MSYVVCTSMGTQKAGRKEFLDELGTALHMTVLCDELVLCSCCFFYFYHLVLGASQIAYLVRALRWAIAARLSQKL